MNGVHDMGGMHGLGPLVREDNEPVFHHDWERRAFALTVAAGCLGRWNIDMSRQAREQMPAADYLAATYYERWLYALQRLLVEKALVTRAEIDTGRAATGQQPADVRVLTGAAVEAFVRKGRVSRAADRIVPRFRAGDHILTRNPHPRGHTRLPRYARGRRGTVARDHGVFVFPDANAAGLGKKPQHLYAVQFMARELWGPAAAPNDAVYIDLWDDYLDPA
jgi:nitrile hydratase subunit beta